MLGGEEPLDDAEAAKAAFLASRLDRIVEGVSGVLARRVAEAGEVEELNLEKGGEVPLDLGGELAENEEGKGLSGVRVGFCDDDDDDGGGGGVAI